MSAGCIYIGVPSLDSSLVIHWTKTRCTTLDGAMTKADHEFNNFTTQAFVGVAIDASSIERKFTRRNGEWMKAVSFSADKLTVKS